MRKFPFIVRCTFENCRCTAEFAPGKDCHIRALGGSRHPQFIEGTAHGETDMAHDVSEGQAQKEDPNDREFGRDPIDARILANEQGGGETMKAMVGMTLSPPKLPAASCFSGAMAERVVIAVQCTADENFWECRQVGGYGIS